MIKKLLLKLSAMRFIKALYVKFPLQKYFPVKLRDLRDPAIAQKAKFAAGIRGRGLLVGLFLVLFAASPTQAQIGITTPSASSGDLIRAADWNKVKLDLETLAAALGALQNQSWESSGADTYYSTGNVGIGVNSPAATLDVYKDAPNGNDNLLRLGTSDDAARFNVDEDGDVFMDGKLVVRNNDIYETDGDLELSGEDSLYLSMDWLNNDADTNNIFFGKNDDGAGTDFIELMRLEETGNLGIGVSAPASKLHVDGSVQVGSDAGACLAGKTGAMRFAGGAIERCDGSNWDALATTNVSDNLGNHTAAQDLDLDTFKLVGNGGTEGISIAADGKIQIQSGTAENVEILSDTGNSVLNLNTQAANAYSILELTGKLSGVENEASVFAAYNGSLNFDTSSSYQFRVSNSEVMRVLPNGNVGIGETDPDSLLQILKTTPTANEVILKIGTDAEPQRFAVDEDGDVFADGNYYVGGGNVVSPSNGGSLTVAGEDNLYLAADWTNDDAENRSIIFGKNAVGAAGGFAELMRIDENGEVGIGVNTPANVLHVIEDDSSDRVAVFENQATTGSPEGLLVLTGQGAGPAPAFAVGTGTEASHTNQFVVTNEGRVGIGSTNPGAYKLDISGTDNSMIRAYSNGGIPRLSLQSATKHFSQSVQSNKLFFFDETAGVSRMVIDANGNVGIGTTAPAAELDVVGTINAVELCDEAGANCSDLSAGLGGGSGKFVNGTVPADAVYTGGNVGIGTTAPGAKLTVLESSSSLTVPKFVVGRSSGEALQFYVSDNQGLIEYTQDGDYTNDLLFNIENVNAGDSAYRFQVNGSEKLAIEETGNVGIGTASPVEKLHVSDSAANLRITDTDTGADSYLLTNSSVGGMIVSADENDEVADSYLGFNVDGTQRVRIDDSGNVGIGTTSPTYRLDLHGESTTLRLRDNSGAVNHLIGADNAGAYTFVNSNHPYRVLVNGSERMRVLANGNVGIGTASPDDGKLQVTGATTGGLETLMVLQNAGTAANTASELILATTTNVAANSNGQTKIRSTRQSDSSNDFSIYTSPGGSVAPLERFTLDGSTGNVGIGTTAPAAELDVAGTIRAVELCDEAGANCSDLSAGLGGGGGNWTQNSGNVYRSTGNVGIGTASPTERFVVTGDEEDDFLGIRVGNNAVSASSLNETTGIMFTHGSGGAASILAGKEEDFTASAQRSSYLSFHTRKDGGGDIIRPSTERLRIDSDGNVGIGTTSPNYNLDIISAASPMLRIRSGVGASDARIGLFEQAGTDDNYGFVLQHEAGANQFQILSRNGSTTGVERFVVDRASGNVGIGTTTPNYPLKVVKTGEAFMAVQSSDNNGDAGLKFFGAGDRGSIYGTAGYDIRIEPNAQYGQADVTFNPKNGTTMNVGIGTTAPQRKLHVQSADGTPSQIQLGQTSQRDYYVGIPASQTYFDIYDASVGASRLAITATGNVGIGTTGPSQKLNVMGAGNTENYMIVGDNADRLKIGYGHSTGVVDNVISAQIFADASGDLNLASRTNLASDIIFHTNAGTNGVERMRIDSDGNVGIGTTSPGAKLEVFGDAAGDGIMISHNNVGAGEWMLNSGFSGVGHPGFYISDSGTARFSIGPSGNVGIGTTSPDVDLDIVDTSNADLELERSGGAKAFMQAQAAVVRMGSAGNHDLDIVTNGGTRMKITPSGETSLTSISSDGTGKVVCIKSDGNLGTCTDTPAAGTCSCS